MFLIGLTGGIGAGKSTVLKLLTKKGAIALEADQLAREIVEPGQPALENIKAAFGADMINEDGTLNRPALSAVAFASENQAKLLNDITHPAIESKMLDFLDQHPDDVVVYENPLLAEQLDQKNYHYDMIVSVEAPQEERVHRLVNNRKMRPEDVYNRMALQVNDEKRREAADVVIVNDGNEEQLEIIVNQLWDIAQDRVHGEEDSNDTEKNS
ncbi:MAG: dephospho-CoA kinase [Micrococcaceae bacterium]